MMNYIWSGMILFSLIFSIFNGTIGNFTDHLMSSCTQAVEFVIGLTGIMAVWSGLMNIAEKSGLISWISQKMQPVMKFLFPEEKDEQTIAIMLMSFITNIFGAGNSATVFSLKAMERLDAENQHSIYASNTMCMFVTTTMSMVQLVPITIIKIRNDLHSIDSGDIIIPSILAGVISMIIPILICKHYERKQRHGYIS